MSPPRTAEDYARDVGAAQVALDRARRLLAARNVIDSIRANPIAVNVSKARVTVEFAARCEVVEAHDLPHDLTDRMRAAVADILADYLAQLESA